MLDPNLPWLAQGYKNFNSEDITKTHSYDDITKLYHINQQDYVKKELRSSTPELRQRRRVKSATIHRQLNRPASGEHTRAGRPNSAFVTSVGMDHRRSRPGSSQSCYRERVGCYEYESEHPPSHSFKPIKPRPKSAIYLRQHRPSSLDRKSVSQVERQFHKERLYCLDVDDNDNHCAFCPTDCRPGSSSSTRPTSSTGLVAAQLPSHYDRYKSWTRPRTAPSTKREFLQRPKNNYVNRSRVPHYTNFIKRIDLGLRDQTPSPPPPPRRRRAFEEPVTTPSPPREPRESRETRSKTPLVVPVKPVEKPKPPDNIDNDEPIRIPTPIEPQQQDEIEPPDEIPSAWTEPRAPTPTPTSSPPPEPADEEEGERIPTPPPPPREPTPPPPPPREEEPKPRTPTPEPEPPREPTPPPPPSPPPPKEPTPPPSPPPQPEPTPPPQEPKQKKEVRIHDPPVVEPPPRPPPQKKEKKPSNLVKRPVVAKSPDPTPEQKPTPKPVPAPIKPAAKPVEVIEEPTAPVQKVEVPSLPEVIEEIKPEEPIEEIPSEPVVPKVEEPPNEPEDPKKKQLGPPPKVKVDVFGRAMDPEYLLDLEMRSRRKGNQDDEDDDEYTRDYKTNDSIPDSAMKKSKMDSWLKGRMALSKRASRFELPMDVMELEGMDQITYLQRYCIVNRRREALYRRAFNRVDKDCDLKINIKEMEKAIEEALVDTIHPHQITNVLELIGAEEGIIIKPKLFSAICALLERLFYHEFVTEDSAEMEGNTKERVEDADFSALDWKLEGCTVNPPLKKLLYKLL